MKIVYMGTPEVAVKPLESLVKSGYTVGYVVTQPDKARDRGKKVQFPPVKEAALALGLEVLQPEKIRGNEEFFNLLKTYEPDIIIVAAYGKLLPAELLELPPLGCINIHASLLPRFRGAAPIQRAILEGDEYTGITLMRMEEGLDTGDMLAAIQTPTGVKRGDELTAELSALGAELLISTLPGIGAGTLKAIPQDHSLATYASRLSKEDGHIDFGSAPEVIERKIRALDPWPGAFCFYKGEPMKVWAAEKDGSGSYSFDTEPGTITEVGPGGIKVSAGKGTIVLKEIQMPGKKRMAVSDYLKGNSIEAGSSLK